MSREILPENLARLVTPRALKIYAQGLGWKPVAGTNGDIALFHRPDSELHQLIVPLDEQFDDYPDRVTEAIARLAEFEHRPALEILSHLLLPPADVFRFRDSSPDTLTGVLPLEQAVSLLEGTRKLLLAQAHSVLRPQPYHPRLSRGEAEQLVNRCRLGQTEGGSFTLTVACPLDLVPGTLFHTDPFARQVTQAVFHSLHDLVSATESNRIDELTNASTHPLLSANFCEALLMLRPSEDRGALSVSITWSKAMPLPEGQQAQSGVQLSQECFEVAEYLAPRLREAPVPKPDAFVGFVDVLRGQPGPDGRPFGEVVVSIIMDDGETIRARVDLSVEDYAVAGAAHLASDPVYFQGYLIRLPRNNRIERIADFRRLESSGAVENPGNS
jgi:hypothetical protein